MESTQGSDVYKKYTRPKVFRRDKDGYIIREMTLADIRIAQNWFCGIAVISPYDFAVALSVFPQGGGFYVGEKDGVVIASAIRIPWAEDVYYGSYYYVAEQFRGAGYGTRLRDEVAKDFVGHNILAIDAVEGKVAAKNEKKFGYVFAFKTERYTGLAKESYGVEYDAAKIVPISDVPFDKIVEYDDKCFVRPNSSVRKAFLEKWFRVAGGASFAAIDSSGHVVGFGQRRPCFQESNHVVGPLYADNGKIAAALLQSLCSDVAGEHVSIDIWRPNEAAKNLVKEFQMIKVFSLDRMHLNGELKEFKETTFGLTSIEMCGF